MSGSNVNRYNYKFVSPKASASSASSNLSDCVNCPRASSSPRQQVIGQYHLQQESAVLPTYLFTPLAIFSC